MRAPRGPHQLMARAASNQPLRAWQGWASQGWVLASCGLRDSVDFGILSQRFRVLVVHARRCHSILGSVFGPLTFLETPMYLQPSCSSRIV